MTLCVNERQVNGTENARRTGGESGGFQISGLNGTKLWRCGREVKKRAQAGRRGVNVRNDLRQASTS